MSDDTLTLRKPFELTSMRILHIAPTLVIKEGTSPGLPQRCTRGHVWNLGFSFVGVEIDLSAFGMTEGPELYCALCLLDALREHCGRVVDGPSQPARKVLV